MPLNEGKLDEVIKIPWKKLFDSMEDGMYYSTNEMSQGIIGKEILGKEAIDKYLNPEKRKTGTMEYLFPNLASYLSDLSYVQAVLSSLVAVSKLKVGIKDRMPYYSKT